ncbi:MAG: DMT family transporter [Siculibacillus sp.]|nr:DMT family transporter [Siculibacillus sp.]
MAPPRDNSRGIVAMNLAMFCFISSDTLVKYVTRSLPLGEAIFLRGAIATLLVAMVVARDGSWRDWRTMVEPRMGLRLVGEIGATLFYLLALVHMPIANVTAVFQATPLAMTASAALFLGEKVGPRRWAAIAVGLVGVMIIVRPGLEGFDVWSLAVLTSVAFVALRDIATARLPADAPSSLVTFTTAAAVTLLGLVMRPFEHLVGGNVEWIVPDPFVAGLVAVNAVAMLGGYVFLLFATRLAETSAIAPFRYTLLVWSFLAGIVVFGQYPDTPTLVGATIVVATGLYSFHRERAARMRRGT